MQSASLRLVEAMTTEVDLPNHAITDVSIGVVVIRDANCAAPTPQALIVMQWDATVVDSLGLGVTFDLPPEGENLQYRTLPSERCAPCLRRGDMERIVGRVDVRRADVHADGAEYCRTGLLVQRADPMGDLHQQPPAATGVHERGERVCRMRAVHAVGGCRYEPALAIRRSSRLIDG